MFFFKILELHLADLVAALVDFAWCLVLGAWCLELNNVHAYDTMLQVLVIASHTRRQQ